MPSKDEDGKPLSGAADRKRVNDALAVAQAMQAERKRLGFKHKKVMAPPKDAIGAIAWANQVAAQLLHETMNDPVITEEARRRTCSELIGKIGLTSSKAITEERLLGLEKKIGMAKNQKDDEGMEADPGAEH